MTARRSNRPAIEVGPPVDGWRLADARRGPANAWSPAGARTGPANAWSRATARARTGRASAWAVAIMAGTGLGLSACGADGPDARIETTTITTVATTTATNGAGNDAPPADPPLDRESAIAAAVDIRADGCGPRVGFGTGAVIGDEAVVTAAHVVAGADDIEVISADGRRTTGEVVLFDPDLDLAVIRTARPAGPPLPLRPDEASKGERGIVVLPRLTAGEMVVDVVDVTVVRPANIRTTNIYREDRVERAGFEIEGSIDPGDSGAMVVLPGGGVGIVWARSNITERRAWAIDLPAAVLNGDAAALTTPADVGPCIR